MIPFAALVAAYLLGSIPFGYLLVKWKTGGDIRASGSGNIGATNVTRTTGRAAGLATLALDVGKGYLAVWLAGRLTTCAASEVSARRSLFAGALGARRVRAATCSADNRPAC